MRGRPAVEVMVLAQGDEVRLIRRCTLAHHRLVLDVVEGQATAAITRVFAEVDSDTVSVTA